MFSHFSATSLEMGLQTTAAGCPHFLPFSYVVHCRHLQQAEATLYLQTTAVDWLHLLLSIFFRKHLQQVDPISIMGDFQTSATGWPITTFATLYIADISSRLAIFAIVYIEGTYSKLTTFPTLQVHCGYLIRSRLVILATYSCYVYITDICCRLVTFAAV